ncbi:MAG: KEOPS complex kinase/ATPase Bud32 [Candidatus Aenigmatarchaeota archaeon]
MFVKIGAEATVKTVDFDNMDAVLKERIRKNYRINELDEKLRSQRTRTEAKITGEARRAGVNTPMVFQTEEKNYKIFFERINGKTLKACVNSGNREKVSIIAEKWGEAVGKLHVANIIHGDLTTSNSIVHDNKIYMIDFGLSFFSSREEDKAEDINLLRQSLDATHNRVFEAVWGAFVAGYLRYGNEKTLERASEIAARGRYVTDRKKGRKPLKITDA